jgi:hypothetical protein
MQLLRLMAGDTASIAQFPVENMLVGFGYQRSIEARVWDLGRQVDKCESFASRSSLVDASGYCLRIWKLRLGTVVPRQE